ncbi:MAG: DUF4445 domain-containing protein [Candidatus Latescibacteria bacterium]|nr:DUF4445 domain-containing protein [Candidatus Latescibacterota bacterium]
MATISHGNKTTELSAGKTLFDYADDLRVKVPTSCGRTGQCHECIVEVASGAEALSPPTGAEHFLTPPYRLACQAAVIDPNRDIRFSVLKRTPQILTRGKETGLDLDPFVQRRGDRVFCGDRDVDAYRGRILGIAADVGTTTVALNLMDLETGACLCTSAFENPQRFGGSDVMHRISYDGGAFRGEMHRAILSALNYEIREMCRRLRLPRQTVYEMVVVGNATMRDLFFDLDVQTIGEKPYKSVTEHEMDAGGRTTTVLTATARALGLRIHPKANIYGGPLIGCHVGADVAADLLAVGMDREQDVVMLVDIGTNTEVVVGNSSRMMAASCPAGPAFEGGLITYGMPGYDGAIQSVALRNGDVSYRTIGDAPAEGICGSGLIDLLAELRRAGKMDELGVFPEGMDRFVVAPDRGITFSREDVSQLAQAKAANTCGQRIVMRNYGVGLEQVKKLYLAGGFANYIDIRHAIEVGFIPNFPEEKIEKVGNASLQGATATLLSKTKRETLERLVRRVEHVELETTPDFFEMFVEGCMFKPMYE